MASFCGMAVGLSIKDIFCDYFSVAYSGDNHATAHGDLRVLNQQVREECAYAKVNEPLLALPHP